MKITIDGVTEEFPALRKAKIAAFLKKRISGLGGRYKGTDIIIHDRPMPGWDRHKPAGYMNFVVVRGSIC